MEVLKDLFQQLTDVEALITWGGYIGLTAIVFAETGLLAGFFLPGDSLLVTAGIFAARGNFDVWLLMLILSAAAIAGDSVGYYIGNKTGKKIFTREKSLFFAKDHLIKAHNFYEKYGAITIILARFMPIIRTFAPTVAGVGEMEYKKFLTYNIVGGIGWISSMLLLGYFLGSVIPNIDAYLHYIIVAIVFLSILPGIVKYLKHRKERTA